MEMELKAENGLIYQRDGDGWTVVASAITGTPEDTGLAEDLAEAYRGADAIRRVSDLQWQLVKCRAALRAAREAINGPQVPGFLTNEELGALELIAEALGEDFDPD